MKRRWIGVVAGLLTAIVSQGGLFDTWDCNARFAFQGYTRPEALTNFTVLVVLAEGSNGFSYAALASPADGADLRFASRDGSVELPYEIESWNTAGVSHVWVKTAVITGAEDAIWAYWGKAGQSVPAYTTNGSAWSGELGVWHMAQTNAADSTSNRFNGAAQGAVSAAAGPVGGACEFHATNDVIQVPDSALFTLSGAFTLSAWIRPTPSTNWQAFMGTYGTNGFIFTIATNADNRLMAWAGGAWKTNASGVPDNAWSHVAYTRNGTAGRFFVNGLPVTNIANATAGGDGSLLQLGGGGTNLLWTSRRFDGRIDEVRLSGAERGTNWIWAAWLNQASNADFFSVSAGFPVLSNTAASAVSNTSAQLGAHLLSAGGSPATVWAFWDVQDRGKTKSWAYATNVAAPPAGAVSLSATGLQPNTNYYYTCYASNATAEVWAEPSLPFETRGPPSVDNGTVYPAYTNAILRGILREGFDAECWFYWGEAAESLTGAVPAGLVSEGPFSAVVTGLQDNTTYYFRCLASNDYGTAWTAVTNFTTPFRGLPWNGAGLNANASNPTNWVGGVRPTNGTVVFLEAPYVKNMTWDLTNIVPGGWNQEESYTGIVTIATRYPGQGAFTNMTINGNVRVMGGVWTHPANTGGDTAADCLRVTVNGDFTLGTNAQVNVERKGYASGKGPGAGSGSSIIQSSFGASHGGMGGQGAGNYVPPAPYGSPFEPVTLGSSTYIVGGGSAKIVVTGTTRLDGLMTAQADQYTTNRQGGAAGGSLFLVTGRLVGGGTLSALGGRGGLDQGQAGSGGGGRIAVHLTDSDTFGNVVMRASGGSSALRAAAGTVYLQTAAQAVGEGRLIVDNEGGGTTWIVGTFMPEPSAYNGTTDLTRLSELVVTNKGVLGIAARTVFDFGTGNLRPQGVTGATVAIQGTSNLAFPPRFDIGGFTLTLLCPVSAAGDWVVTSNGVLTHPLNITELYRINLSLSGNFTVDAGGAVNANEKGYRPANGPAPGTTSQYGSPGAGHGGQGAWGGTSGALSSPPKPAYGCVTAPTNIGSGANYSGGGAVRIEVTGTTTVNGVISATQIPNQALMGNGGGAGGSIWIRTGFLRGTGTVDVTGGPSMGQSNAGSPNGGGGGGGRLAVILTESGDFDQVRLLAAGGTNLYAGGIYSGAAGTVYTETAAQGFRRGRLLIANANRTLNALTNGVTQLPATTNAVAGELDHVTVVLSNRAYAALTADLKIGDLFILTNTPNTLYLKGYTLNVEARRHADWGITNYVVYDGGQIVWGAGQGTVILIR